jgi:DNA-binding LacI/PurR family transcriptional regulator
VSFAADDTFPETLETAGVPVVAAGRGQFVRYSVDVDNRGGAWRAVNHLIAGGRRRIATIAGPGELAVSTDRLEGWRDALRDAGLEPLPELVEVGDYAQASGRLAADRLLDRVPDIDALFAASDLMAFGALEALRAAGRRVPDDVAVVGFDNVPAAATTDPALTTVSQPVVETGRAMTRLLLDRLAGAVVTETHTVLPTELVKRASA